MPYSNQSVTVAPSTPYVLGYLPAGASIAVAPGEGGSMSAVYARADGACAVREGTRARSAHVTTRPLARQRFPRADHRPATRPDRQGVGADRRG
jgi:hypothetical protein